MTQPLRLAFICTGWGRRHGGVSVMNLNLASAAARNGHTVFCVVSSCEGEAEHSAKASGVELIVVAPAAGHEGTPLVAAGRVVAQALAGLELDWVIGHDTISGREAIDCGRLLRIGSILVRHHDYTRYAGMKSGSTEASAWENQRKNTADANVCVATGPLLAREAARVRREDVVALVPGMEDIEPRDAGDVFTIFASGRFTDRTSGLKQHPALVDAVGRFAGQTVACERIRLVMFGWDKDAAERATRRVRALAGRHVECSLRGYTDDPATMFEELALCTVAVMPSLHEGFGLNGWEALAAGVPLVLSADSGLAEFLTATHGPANDAFSLVSLNGSPDPSVASADDVEALITALQNVWDSRDTARDAARTIRVEHRREHTWEVAAARMLEEANAHPTFGEAARPTLAMLSQQSARAVAEGASRVPLADVWVEREAAEQVQDWLSVNDSGLLLLLGEAGRGKTSLLWDIDRRLSADGYETRLVPAPELVGLGGARLRSELADFSALAPFNSNRRAVLVDTLDVVASDPTRADQLREWLLDWSDGIIVIGTSRPHQASSLRADASTTLPVPEYTVNELQTAIERHARRYYQADPAAAALAVERLASATGLGQRIGVICRVPLHLRMLFELYAPAEINAAEVDLVGLYSDYWGSRVQTDSRHGNVRNGGGDLSLAAGALGVAMLTLGTTSVGTHVAARAVRRCDAEHVHLDRLQARGVLTRRGANTEFFHQTFMEHAAAVGTLNRLGSVSFKLFETRLKQRPLDLFVKPVALRLLTLGMASDDVTIRNVAENWFWDLASKPATATMAVYAFVHCRRTLPSAAGAKLAECVGGIRAAAQELAADAPNTPVSRRAEVLAFALALSDETHVGTKQARLNLAFSVQVLAAAATAGWEGVLQSTDSLMTDALAQRLDGSQQAGTFAEVGRIVQLSLEESPHTAAQLGRRLLRAGQGAPASLVSATIRAMKLDGIVAPSSRLVQIGAWDRVPREVKLALSHGLPRPSTFDAESCLLAIKSADKLLVVPTAYSIAYSIASLPRTNAEKLIESIVSAGPCEEAFVFAKTGIVFLMMPEAYQNDGVQRARSVAELGARMCEAAFANISEATHGAHVVNLWSQTSAPGLDFNPPVVPADVVRIDGLRNIPDVAGRLVARAIANSAATFDLEVSPHVMRFALADLRQRPDVRLSEVLALWQKTDEDLGETLTSVLPGSLSIDCAVALHTVARQLRTEASDLGRENRCAAALNAFREIGSLEPMVLDQVGALVDHVQHPGARNVRMAAWRLIAARGPDANDAAEFTRIGLELLANSDDPDLLNEVVRALGSIVSDRQRDALVSAVRANGMVTLRGLRNLVDRWADADPTWCAELLTTLTSAPGFSRLSRYAKKELARAYMRPFSDAVAAASEAVRRRTATRLVKADPDAAQMWIGAFRLHDDFADAALQVVRTQPELVPTETRRRLEVGSVTAGETWDELWTVFTAPQFNVGR